MMQCTNLKEEEDDSLIIAVDQNKHVEYGNTTNWMIRSRCFYALTLSLVVIFLVVSRHHEGQLLLQHNDSATTMVPVIWNEHDQAKIEFCQEDDGPTYGYRLPGTNQPCGPAGVVLRLRPGENYTLILRNELDEPTNLHFHGFHAMVDNALMSIEPGMSFEYHLNIPSDHAGGTFWMHSHMHHLTERQVSGGAYAMVIVEENPRILENVPSEHDRQSLSQWFAPENELLLLVSKTNSGTLIANGKHSHSMYMVRDRWYRMRIAAVDKSDKRTKLVLPSACQVHVVAYDGIWRRQVPHPDSILEHSMTGASRLDLAIRCSASGDFHISYGGTKVATVFVLNPERNALRDRGAPFLSGRHPWRPWRPTYLQDMFEYDSDMFQTFTVRALEDSVNDRKFDPEDPLLEIKGGSFQEWKLKYTNWHPFHLHVFPMQTINCSGHEDGEFYDTVMSSDDVCTVRFRAVDFKGDIFFHCHVLAHSDAGSMAFVRVSDDGHGNNTILINGTGNEP